MYGVKKAMRLSRKMVSILESSCCGRENEAYKLNSQLLAAQSAIHCDRYREG
jgi:hypothetical protein